MNVCRQPQSVFFKAIVFGLLLTSVTWAQTGSNQNKLADELSKESSNYTPAPDPLDPLPQKKESLKEDEEPVLDDIKQVLDAPLKKKEKKTTEKKVIDKASAETQTAAAPETSAEAAPPPPEITDQPAAVTTTTPVETAPPVEPPVKKIKKKIIKKKIVQAPPVQPSVQEQAVEQPSAPVEVVSKDEPNLKLEKKLNQYRAGQGGDVSPTSEADWLKAAESAHIQEFIVQPGNTLEGISLMLFGDRQFWPKIWSLNNPKILNPHEIFPGSKIVFMAGTIENTPAVKIAPPAPQSQPAEFVRTREKSVNFVGKSPDGREYNRQFTEIEKHSGESGGHRNGPEPLPKSFPIHRDIRFYVKDKEKTDIVVELTPNTESKSVIPPNNYFLSADMMTSDYEIGKQTASEIICKNNHYVREVKKINSDAKPGVYVVVDRLDPQVSSRFKSTYIYKKIGTVEVSANNSMRIKGCETLVNSDSLLVPESRLMSLRPPTEQVYEDLRIIEGLEFMKQTVFNSAQFVVLSQNQQLAVGQDYDVYSDDVGGVVGRIKVLQITGTMAIGFVTNIKNVVTLGDKLQSKNDAEEGLDSQDYSIGQ